VDKRDPAVVLVAGKGGVIPGTAVTVPTVEGAVPLSAGAVSDF
jgi:hypothetical protein